MSSKYRIDIVSKLNTPVLVSNHIELIDQKNFANLLEWDSR